MTSLIAVLALISLSCLPVARADLQCDMVISGTNICFWLDHHYGVAIASVGGIVTLVVFLVFSACSSRPQRAVFPARPYPPSDQSRVQGREISVPLPAEPYAFSVPRQSCQGSERAMSEREWTNVDLTRH